jgi:hypothetical protein
MRSSVDCTQHWHHKAGDQELRLICPLRSGLILARRPVCKLFQLIRAISCEAHEFNFLRCQFGLASCLFDLGAQMLLDRESREVAKRVADSFHALE